MFKKYIIAYESAHWCGGQSYCVVEAFDEMNAEDIADSFMDESMRELFMGEHADEPEDDEDPAYSVNSVEEFDENHDLWKFYIDPIQQANFYPHVNF